MLQSGWKKQMRPVNQRGFTVGGRLCRQGRCSESNGRILVLTPGTGITLLADLDRTESVHVAQLPVIFFVCCFIRRLDRFSGLSLFLVPASGHVSQP